MTEAEAEKAVAEARRALSAVESEVREAEAVAKAQARAGFSDRLAAAHAAVVASERAHRDVLNATPDHEWAGRRVFYMKARGRVWERRPPERVEGIVEVRRIGTEFPANVSHYSLPQIGKPFVRLLKKDGTPGSKFDRSLYGWKLAEGSPEAAQA